MESASCQELRLPKPVKEEVKKPNTEQGCLTLSVASFVGR